MPKIITALSVTVFVIIVGAYVAWSYKNSGGPNRGQVEACKGYLTSNSQNPTTVVFQPVSEWSISQTGEYNWELQAWMDERDGSGKKVRKDFTCIASKFPDGHFEAHTIKLLSESGN
jgi:hypothetical protein